MSGTSFWWHVLEERVGVIRIAVSQTFRHRSVNIRSVGPLRRSRLETINVILTISVHGIKKTHIMYRANLSYRQLEKYVELLVSKQLLAKQGDAYVTTDKGFAYIKEFRDIQALMSEEVGIKTFY